MRKLRALATIWILLLPSLTRAGHVLAQAEVRIRDWTQTIAAEFATGQMAGVTVTDVAGGELRLSAGATTGTYTSTVTTADFPFNAIAAHWAADLPSGTGLWVELRTFAKPDGWSDWHPIDDPEWIASKGEFYPEAPIMLSDGQQFQYRVTMATWAGDSAAAVSPILRQMTLTYMDTSAGPTTTQAKIRMQVGRPTAQGVPQPAWIARAGWGANEDYRTWEPECYPVSKIVVHHTVTTNDYAEDDAAEWVRAIYYYHAVTLGWGDIGYNYMVDRYGNIYEGRYGGPGAVGAHVLGYNYGSMGIGLLGTHGNYANSVVPVDVTLEAVADLSVWEASRSYVHPLESAPFWDAAPPNLAGHRDYPPYSTSCPGDLAYAELPGLRQQVWDRLVAAIPQYEVSWIAWDAPSFQAVTLGAKETYTLAMTVRNTGWFTWPHAGTLNLVRLGYHWLDGDGQAVVQPPEDDHRTPLAEDVAFGHSYEFPSVQVTTPVTPGTYTLAWDMVHEGISWFHDAGANSPLLTMTLTVTGTVPPGPEGVRNGGFEYDGEWTMYQTSYPARYTDQTRHSGNRALQTGIEGPSNSHQSGASGQALVENVYSYSSAGQTFNVPSAGHATLSYWHQAWVDSGDYAYVLLRPVGEGWQFLQVIRQDVASWTQTVCDLSAYAGQTVDLRFGTYNDGGGDVSAMYVDDVSTSEGQPATPTPSPTPTATPTPVPPTTTPAPCSELATNGDFETDEGWAIVDTVYRARYTHAVARTGQRSLQVGIADPAENRFSYSSAEQWFSIPAGLTATLSLWYNVTSDGGSGDYGYLLVRPDGGSWVALRIVGGETDGWVALVEDVSHYAGQAFTLRLGMRNDGEAEHAVMYVDTLSLQGCNP